VVGPIKEDNSFIFVLSNGTKKECCNVEEYAEMFYTRKEKTN